MFSATSRFHAAGVAVLLLLSGLSAAVGEAESYVAPNFHKKVFDPDRVLLGKRQRDDLCAALVAAAANFPATPQGVNVHVKEMALAIALRIDAVNAAAHAANARLLENQTPPKVDGFESKAAIAARLRQYAQILGDANAVEDENILVCYLLDIARHLEPSNAEGVALFQSSTDRASYPGWGGVLNGNPDSGFLFPTELEPANPGTGDPDPSVDPPEPTTAGDPNADLKLESGAVQMLGFAKGPAGNMIGTAVTLTLKADPSIREAGEPLRVLFPSSVLSAAIPLAQTADQVIAALARLNADWPASGRKIVARFEPDYLPENGRGGELALALALDALYAGKVPEPIPTAVGTVSGKGAIGPAGSLRRILHSLNPSIDCDRVLIPAASEGDLTDIAVVGDIRPLLRLQLLKVDTLTEAIRYARGDFSAEELKALLDFSEIRNVASRSSSPTEILRTEIVRSRLGEIVAALPQHVSASLLLRFASGDLPERLSPAATVEELRMVIFPFVGIVDKMELVSGSNAESLRARTSARMTSLRDKLAPELVAVGDQIEDFGRTLETYAKLNSKDSTKARDLSVSLQTAWQDINRTLDFPDETAPPTEDSPAPEEPAP